MRILIGTFLLAGQFKEQGYAPSGALMFTTSPDAFEINGRRVAQEAQFLRATYAKMFDRGNALNTVTFDTTREFPNIPQAQAFLLEHETRCPRSGLVTFELRYDSGAIIRRYINAAVISSVRRRHVGVTTIHSYEILGGEILLTKPTS